MRFREQTVSSKFPTTLRSCGRAMLVVCVCCATNCLTALPSLAQVTTPPFRMESQVYVNDGQTPVSQNVTLFDDRIVYDFQIDASTDASPSEIVIFDEHKRELVLLDVGRKLSWTVADLRLLKMLDQLRHETVNNDKASFLVKQSFKESHDWSSNVVALENASFRYLLTGTRPKNETILQRYHDFLDQFTRLGASDPKRLPPFPRLALNKTIKSLGWIPAEVKVEVEPNAFFKEGFKATSKHMLSMSLSEADRKRIEFARKCLFEFEPCTLPEYRQIPAATKRLAFQSKNNSTTDDSRR